MNNRERAMAVLHYQPYDRMPVVAFGYWTETLDKWAEEGHISAEIAHEVKAKGENCEAGRELSDKLGIDFHWSAGLRGNDNVMPGFPRKVLNVRRDGAMEVQDSKGHIVLEKPGVDSIPGELGTLLTDREAWEELYLPKLQLSQERVCADEMEKMLQNPDYISGKTPIALHCGSLYGDIRDWLGVEQLSYLAVDDEELYREIIDTNANLKIDVTEKMLTKAEEIGLKFDYAHFWEDICFKNGPLVNPVVFEELVAPHYKRLTKVLNDHGIDIVSLDCDGCIDLLLPIWLKNGVNTMFPIEVGTWKASILPWREKYGKDLLGVGGMDKKVFAYDKAAIDNEVERLKPLVELGGYIPCVDHRIPPDAKFELVQYYCDKIRETF